MAVFSAGAKIMKPQGEKADEFELSISQVRNDEITGRQYLGFAWIFTIENIWECHLKVTDDILLFRLL